MSEKSHLITLAEWHENNAAIYQRTADNDHNMAPDWAVAEAPAKRDFHLGAAAILRNANKATPAGNLPLPTSVEEARGMAILGTNYLQEHAPEALRIDPTGEIAAGRFALAAVYQWLRGPGSHFPHGVSGIADALKAFLAGLPRGMRQFKHLKRGSSYALVGDLTVQTKTPVVDGEVLLTYIDEKGAMWGRREAEFFDGRFEEIKA